MVPGAGPAAEGHEGQRGRADAAGEPRALLFEPRLRVPPARARLGRGGAPRRRAAPLGGAEPQGQDTQVRPQHAAGGLWPGVLPDAAQHTGGPVRGLPAWCFHLAAASRRDDGVLRHGPADLAGGQVQEAEGHRPVLGPALRLQPVHPLQHSLALPVVLQGPRGPGVPEGRQVVHQGSGALRGLLLARPDGNTHDDDLDLGSAVGDAQAGNDTPRLGVAVRRLPGLELLGEVHRWHQAVHEQGRDGAPARPERRHRGLHRPQNGPGGPREDALHLRHEDAQGQREDLQRLRVHGARARRAPHAPRRFHSGPGGEGNHHVRHHLRVRPARRVGHPDGATQLPERGLHLHGPGLRGQQGHQGRDRRRGVRGLRRRHPRGHQGGGVPRARPHPGEDVQSRGEDPAAPLGQGLEEGAHAPRPQEVGRGEAEDRSAHGPHRGGRDRQEAAPVPALRGHDQHSGADDAEGPDGLVAVRGGHQ
mmetsp:Transcript_69560/g.197273  ORF Transcript_69560/g.197273 Transcript_69560/m.197273 type:complete len:476 (-) Transcript_69560:2046-3473(-)